MAYFSGSAQPYHCKPSMFAFPTPTHKEALDAPSSVSPVTSAIAIDSPHAPPVSSPFEFPPHANMSAPLGSPPLYGWNHPAGTSLYHSPHLHASSPTREAYYDQESYLVHGTRRSRPSSPNSGYLKQNMYDQPWPYPH